MDVKKSENNLIPPISENLKDYINTFADLKTLLFSYKTAVTIVGTTLLAKRSGLMPAVKIILRSRFKPLFLKKKSVRYAFINEFRSKLKKVNYSEGEYILVMGEKGIGKTTAVQTALHQYCGVIKFVLTEDNYTGLVSTVETKLLGGMSTGMLTYLFRQSLNSLLFWHRLFMRRPPIIVIEVFEGISNKLRLLSTVRQVSSIYIICSSLQFQVYL